MSLQDPASLLVDADVSRPDELGIKADRYLHPSERRRKNQIPMSNGTKSWHRIITVVISVIIFVTIVTLFEMARNLIIYFTDESGEVTSVQLNPRLYFTSFVIIVALVSIPLLLKIKHSDYR